MKSRIQFIKDDPKSWKQTELKAAAMFLVRIIGMTQNSKDLDSEVIDNGSLYLSRDYFELDCGGERVIGSRVMSGN
jgi:hypothetical protein